MLSHHRVTGEPRWSMPLVLVVLKKPFYVVPGEGKEATHLLRCWR